MLIKSSTRVLLIYTVLVNLWLGIPLSAAVPQIETSNEPTAKQVVEEFQAQLLDAMKLPSYSERYQKLTNPVLSSHDLAFIIRVGIRNEWKKLTLDQKQQLVKVFSHLAVAEYAKNFKDYSDQSFIFDSEEPTKQGKGVVVRMRLQVDKDEQVKFSYSMKKRRGDWKILFITAKGVNQSLVRTKEYDSILRREGFDALIARISGKIEEYSKQ